MVIEIANGQSDQITAQQIGRQRAQGDAQQQRIELQPQNPAQQGTQGSPQTNHEYRIKHVAGPYFFCVRLSSLTTYLDLIHFSEFCRAFISWLGKKIDTPLIEGTRS